MNYSYLKILFLFISVLMHYSCSENKTVELKKSDAAKMVTQDTQIEKKADFPVLIEPEKLTTFLPVSVPGTEKTPYKTGSIDEDELKVSVASCEYVFPNHGFLKFSINDYGSKKFIPDYELRLFDYPPSESGKETEQFIIANGKGYAMWDEFRKEGMLFALVSDRFILRIDATRLPVTYVKLQDYIKYFRTKELIDFKR